MPRQKVNRLVAVLVLCSFLVFGLSKLCLAQNYEQSYFLIRGHSTYQLTLSVTHSLYEYYQQKSHRLTQNNFATFVTPYSLALVAADIRSIFSEEEDFANAVLMLVHQIPYQIVEGVRYPVETIVANEGDCDLLSYIAASLIKAQSLGVVLLYYEQQSHMNIGVSLPAPPSDARTTISYVDYGGTRYYMAECTGEDWRNGWRVGECPSELEGAQVTVVTLENCEQIAPGQVSSSFGTLEPSTISLVASRNFVLEGSEVVLSGQVSVSGANGTVTLYAGVNGAWFSIGTTNLEADGRYMYSWKPASFGQCYVKASWSGNGVYAGADSMVVSVFVIPMFLVIGGGGFLVITMVGVVLFLMHKSTSQETTGFEEYSDGLS